VFLLDCTYYAIRKPYFVVLGVTFGLYFVAKYQQTKPRGCNPLGFLLYRNSTLRFSQPALESQLCTGEEAIETEYVGVVVVR
jgi:hypothetical protein